MADWLTELSGQLNAVSGSLGAEELSLATTETTLPAGDEPTPGPRATESLADRRGSCGTAVTPVLDAPDTAASFVSAAERSLYPDLSAWVERPLRLGRETSTQAAERGGRAARAPSPRNSSRCGAIPPQPPSDGVADDGDDSVSDSWLDQSVSASLVQSLPTPASASLFEHQEEAEAKLAYDRARLRNEWESLTREKVSPPPSLSHTHSL